MKTQNEIFPLLVSKCETLGWKINKSSSASKNLDALINKVSRLEKKVRDGKLNSKDESHVRQTLIKAMNELGQTLSSLKSIAKSLESETSRDLEQSFKTKSTPTLWAEMLANLKNTEKIRKESTQFLEAWREIESNHFTKITLYNIEIERRNMK